VWRDRRAPRALRSCVALLLLLRCGQALAVADCSVSATGVAFGIYDPTTTAPNDSSGNVTVVCTHVSGGASQISYSVALSTGGSGTYAQRRLSGTSTPLAYNLYTNTARSIVWGNGTAGTAAPSNTVTVGPGVGNGRREDVHPMYGRISAQQDALQGSYSDSIVITLTF